MAKARRWCRSTRRRNAAWSPFCANPMSSRSSSASRFLASLDASAEGLFRLARFSSGFASTPFRPPSSARSGRALDGASAAAAAGSSCRSRFGSSVGEVGGGGTNVAYPDISAVVLIVGLFFELAQSDLELEDPIGVSDLERRVLADPRDACEPAKLV